MYVYKRTLLSRRVLFNEAEAKHTYLLKIRIIMLSIGVSFQHREIYSLSAGTVSANLVRKTLFLVDLRTRGVTAGVSLISGAK